MPNLYLTNGSFLPLTIEQRESTPKPENPEDAKLLKYAAMHADGKSATVRKYGNVPDAVFAAWMSEEDADARAAILAEYQPDAAQKTPNVTPTVGVIAKSLRAGYLTPEQLSAGILALYTDAAARSGATRRKTTDERVADGFAAMAAIAAMFADAEPSTEDASTSDAEATEDAATEDAPEQDASAATDAEPVVSEPKTRKAR